MRTSSCEWKEFTDTESAFACAESLSDGVVLDWGRCYVVVERERLSDSFAIELSDQPIVTKQDFLIRPAPPYILARRVGERGCCTSFVDDRESWSESVYEVIEDSTGTYKCGQRLWTRLSPNESARPSIGRNWRMKLLRPEDVQAVLPPVENENEITNSDFKEQG